MSEGESEEEHLMRGAIPIHAGVRAWHIRTCDCYAKWPFFWIK